MAKISRIKIAGTVHELADAQARATIATLQSSMATVYRYAGSVPTYGELPALNQNSHVGDVYNVSDTGANYAWTGTEWDKLSETVDLSGYVEKVAGKGLSDNNFSTEEKQKLAGIAAGATNITVDASLSDTSENPVKNKAVKSALDAKAPLASPEFTGTPKAPTATAGTNTTQVATTAFVGTAVSGKVDKVSGKGLSTNDYTTAEKQKLAAIGGSVGTADAEGYSTLELTFAAS